MRPLRLFARNFIGLREVDISFEGKGLFIIQGPNGAGKSSILEAIFFALYGETLRHGSVGYEGVINRSSNEGRALVELEFSHQGKRWRIKREVYASSGKRSSAVYLECLDSLEKSASSRDASKRLERLLGLTSDTFKTTVLLPQGEITSFLELTGTKRMKVLKELLGGSRLERIIDEVDSDFRTKSGELQGYQAQLSSINLEGLKKEREAILPQIGELEIKINEINEEIELLERELKDLRAEEILLKDLAKDRELKESLEKRRGSILSRLSQIESEIRDKSLERDGLLSALKRLEGDYERERKFFEELERAWSSLLPLRSELSSLERDINGGRVKVERIEKELEELLKRLERSKEVYMSLLGEEERLKREYESARDRYFIHELKKSLKVGDVCPLCGSKISALPLEGRSVEYEELRKYKRLYDEASKRLKEEERTLASIEQGIRERQEMKRELLEELSLLREKLEVKEKEYKSILASIEAMFGKRDIESLRDEKRKVVEGLRKDRESISGRLSAVEASLRGLEDERFRLRGELSELEKEISSLVERIKEMESKVRSASELEKIKGEISSLESKIRDLRSKVSFLTSELWRKKSRLESIDKDMENYASLKKRVEVLEEEVHLLGELKRNLSDSNFPKFLVSHYLIEAAEQANGYLSRLTKGRYSIEATEELDIFVIDEEIGGGRRSIKDLSGGEKVLISLSLALGIAEVLAGGLEAFFIDEGFSPLDRDNLGMVAHELLELDNTGKLVGIITHDSVFADYFTTKLMVNGGRAWWV